MSAAKLQADLEDVLIQTIKDRRFCEIYDTPTITERDYESCLPE